MKLNHLIIIGALCGALLLPSSASSWGVVGLSAGSGGGGCDSACDPASNEVGRRTEDFGVGTFNAGTTCAAKYVPDCDGYLDVAYIRHYGTNTATARCLVYLDDGDGAPDAGDSLIYAFSGVTNSSDGAWAASDASTDCDQVSTESTYWVVLAVDDNSANGWAYMYYGGAGSQFYTIATNFYDSPPSTLNGSWTGPTTRNLDIYVSLK